jgi:hypothetical protein
MVAVRDLSDVPNFPFMNLFLRSFFSLILFASLFASTGCNSSKKKNFDTTVARFFMEASEGDAFASVTLPVSGVRIAINNRPVVTEYDFTGVQLAESDLGKFLIFSLTRDAALDIYRTTVSNQGKRLVLFINGKPVGARMIDQPFNTGAIAVFAAIPDDLLPKLVKNLHETSVDIQEKIEKAKK